MDHDQYRRFLNDPAAFMNAGPVRRLRISMVPGGAGFRNTVQFTANYPGAVPTFFQYSDSMVTPVSLRYDNNGIPATSALWAQTNRPANGNFVNDRAYYLQWNADQAYAITLGQKPNRRSRRYSRSFTVKKWPGFHQVQGEPIHLQKAPTA